MTRNLALALAIALPVMFGLAAPARADEMHLVLELVTLSDDTATRRVALYANDIDPNSWANSDRYRLEVDGRRRSVPATLLSRLDHDRRDFSYDSLSGGIRERTQPANCLLDAPATGDILRVRYLTYDADALITGSEMRDVLSEAGNCRFAPDIAPRNAEALRAAVKVMAELQTLRDLVR